MDLWFLHNSNVLHREREAFDTLKKNSAWLNALDWAIEDQQLCVHVAISVAGVEYKAKLIYPMHFPDAPPIVLPQSPQRRWSTHQYGENGSLCLEWGPDNWISSVTGAQMVSSMYKLLSTENFAGTVQSDEQRIIAPSRHFLEVGQELRGRCFRFLITKPLMEYLNTKANSKVLKYTMRYSLNWLPDALVAMIHEIGSKEDNSLWFDEIIPSNLCGRDDTKELCEGLFLYDISFTESQLKAIDTADKLLDVVVSAGFNRDEITADLKRLTEQKKLVGICLVGSDKTIYFCISFDNNKIYRFCAVYAESSSSTPVDPSVSNKKVCVIGLGSVGSKIVDTLARAGVNKFYLVDYDIFLPHNISRHVLNWEDVGEHKTKVVKRLLGKIAKNIDVDIGEINITGQESNLNLDACLRKIAQYDLIIDATANERVFNLISSVVKQEKKPFVWSSVFEGGRGGLVARYLPDKDPLPEIIRAAFNQFCCENPFPESKTTFNYATEDRQGKIMVATDIDVSVIAYNAARISFDCLLENYEYKYQIYLIGLGTWWVFKCPLDIIPIDCSNWRAQSLTSESQNNFSADDKSFLQELIQKRQKK